MMTHIEESQLLSLIFCENPGPLLMLYL